MCDIVGLQQQKSHTCEENFFLRFIDELEKHLHKNPKNQKFEKWKNLQEISSFYTYVPKITIVWSMVPEIQSETERIFCHFGPFFSLLPTPLMISKIKVMKKNNKMRQSLWCMVPEIWCMTDKILCLFGPFFALLSL